MREPLTDNQMKDPVFAWWKYLNWWFRMNYWIRVRYGIQPGVMIWECFWWRLQERLAPVSPYEKFPISCVPKEAPEVGQSLRSNPQGVTLTDDGVSGRSGEEKMREWIM